MRVLKWLVVAPVALVLVGFAFVRGWAGPATVEAPPPAPPAVDNAPAVLLLDAERHAEIRWVLESKHRVYLVKRWAKPDPSKLSEMVGEIDEDQLILVGPTSAHMRTEELPPHSPIVVGRIPLKRSDGEVAFNVDRLAERARSPMVEERELYRLVRSPHRRV